MCGRRRSMLIVNYAKALSCFRGIEHRQHEILSRMTVHPRRTHDRVTFSAISNLDLASKFGLAIYAYWIDSIVGLVGCRLSPVEHVVGRDMNHCCATNLRCSCDAS